MFTFFEKESFDSSSEDNETDVLLKVIEDNEDNDNESSSFDWNSLVSIEHPQENKVKPFLYEKILECLTILKEAEETMALSVKNHSNTQIKSKLLLGFNFISGLSISPAVYGI